MTGVALDRDQRKALALDRDVAVTAGAGAGKTRVLVERYVEALRADPAVGPESILAITFTDAAAAEMTERVREAVRDLARQTDDARWAEVEAALGGAWISTIHAFAARLLRRHGAAVGVDPGFEVIDEGTARSLRADAVDRALARLEARRDPDLGRVGRVMSSGALVRDIERVVDGWSGLPRWLREAPSEERLLLAGRRAARAGRRRLTRAVGGQVARNRAFRRAVETLSGLGGSGGDEASGLLRRLERLLEADRRPLQVEEALEAADAFLTGSGRPRSGFKRRIDGEAWGASVEEVNDALCRAAKRLRPLREVRRSAGASDPLGREVLPAFVRLARRVHRTWERTKEVRNVLEYDDLETRVVELLEGGSFRDRFRHVLVDELQDVTPVQWSIVRRLHGDRTRLFVVGDPKQSIYAFRDADVAGFEATCRAVRALNREAGRTGPLPTPEGTVEPDGPEEAAGLVSMPATYRASEAVASFVNETFSRLFDGEPVFEPLDPRRPDAGAAGSVELLDPGRVDGPAVERRRARAGLAARRIRAMVRGPEARRLEVAREGEVEPAGWDDIACLIQSRTFLPALRSALDAEGVPHVFCSGSDPTDRDEVQDLLHLLRFVQDARDDHALHGLLRGSWFAVPDETLVLLAGLPGRSLWARLLYAVRRGPGPAADLPEPRRAPPEPGPDARRLLGLLDRPAEEGGPSRARLLGRATAALHRWRRLGRRLPVGELLRRALEESGALVALAAGPDGEEALDAVRDILDEAGRHDAGGGDLPGFIERIEAGPARRPGPADGDGGGGRVRILTVHGAKGLEFPVVVLPQADRPVGRSRARRPGVLLDRHLGIGLPVDDPERDRPGTVVRDLVASTGRRRRLGEEKRLFYVAATRARDHLVVVGSGEKESWAAWSRRPWSDGGAGRAVRFLEADDLPDRPGEPELPSGEGPAGEPEAEPVEVGASPVPFRTTATEVAAWVSCPRRFHLRHVVGLEERGPLTHRPRRRTYGIACHRALERVAAGRTPAEAAREAAREHGTGEAERRRLERAATHLAEGLLARVPAETAETERSFLLPTSETGTRRTGVVAGTVDLVLPAGGSTPDEQLLVVDHKTVPEPDDPEALLRRYEVPMGIYRLMVAEAHGVSPARVGARLWLTETGRELAYPPWDEGEAAAVQEDLARRVGAMARAAGAATPEDLPANPEACAGCGFGRTGICPVPRAGEPGEHGEGSPRPAGVAGNDGSRGNQVRGD